MQPLQVQIKAVVHQRIDKGQPDGTAQIPGKIKQAGRIFDSVWRHGSQSQIVNWHHAQHQAAATQHLWKQQLIEIPVLGQTSGEIGAAGKHAEPNRNHPARVGFAHQFSGDRRCQKHANAGDKHGLTNLQRRIAAHTRQVHRIKIGKPIKPYSHHK